VFSSEKEGIIPAEMQKPVSLTHHLHVKFGNRMVFAGFGVVPEVLSG
jgi:hypothetical protein